MTPTGSAFIRIQWEGEVPPPTTKDALFNGRSWRGLNPHQIEEILHYLVERDAAYFEVKGRRYHRGCGGQVVIFSDYQAICSVCDAAPQIIPPLSWR